MRLVCENHPTKAWPDECDCGPGMNSGDGIISLAEKLIAQVADDNKAHGGLSSRATIRASDELRMAISKHRAAT